MSKNIKLIIAITLFLIGLIIFIYPIVSNYLYEQKIENKEEKFEKIIKLVEENNNQENNDNKKNNGNSSINNLYDLLYEENNKMYYEKQETFLNQSISFEKTLINLTKYGLEENVIGFLEIPSIDIKLPIYLGASNQNMKYGAVHLTGTSYPIGGINTNSVIAAHRGYYKYKMFRHIDKISIGDILYIKNFNGILEYKAVKIEIIEPSELNKLTIQENKDMITIISCHPFPQNYQRYAVFFERMS